MKGGYNPMEVNPNPGSTAFADYCTQSNQEGLNSFPLQVRSRGMLKQSLQHLTLLTIKLFQRHYLLKLTCFHYHGSRK
ncbi:hypothetical protein PROH_01430 [Prochlorothrix hollandica PCC 9006 = CALU 1027]|uniref:Uncharacterized protein n=1 Tax=Prochlorothrix hollandica PCC 9006 = CALU 1027 TaxID=317619 RepID=A0A0M2Q3C6_PROHO|nr:hypothetical protein PROH_01430 [Prochlorothrix hollandica PCC 9006 = CALU 1027]